MIKLLDHNLRKRLGDSYKIHCMVIMSLYELWTLNVEELFLTCSYLRTLSKYRFRNLNN